MEKKIGNFFIKNNYKINTKDKARQDDFTENTVEYEQPDVYSFVKHLAQRCNIKYIIDIGCVYHYQTTELYPEFQIIGIGCGENLQYCMKQYKFAKWIDVDFTNKITISISEEILKESIIVCADIVEHLDNPTHLIELLRRFLNYSPYAILTAINRDHKNTNDDGRPLNSQHVREWNFSEFNQLVSENFNLSNIGLTINNHKDKEKNIIIALLQSNNVKKISDKIQVPEDFSVTSIIHSFNEEDIIIPSITNLLEQGIKVYVIDNWSTDNTFQLLSNVKHKGFLGVEKFPKDKAPEYYDLRAILQRKEEISHEFGLGWYIHTDVDEIRVSPWKNISFRDGIYLVDTKGYNAIDFSVITFHPKDNNFKSGRDFEDYFKHFSLGEDLSYFIQVKAWKNFGQDINLAYWGGHNVEFDKRKIFPLKFLCKHYPIRSQEHGKRKIFLERRKRYHPKNRAIGWHAHYDKIKDDHNFVEKSSKFLYYESDFYEQFMLERIASIGNISEQTIANARVNDFQISWVNKDKHVIAMGIATQYVAKILKQKCKITTVVKPENKETRSYADKIIESDLTPENIIKSLKEEKFDIIELGDTLEKIYRQKLFLKNLRENIIEDGCIICYFHNSSHGYITVNQENNNNDQRLNFLKFDLEHIKKLFESTGYIIEKLERIKLNVFAAYEQNLIPKKVSREKILYVLQNSEATTLYYIVKAKTSIVKKLLLDKEKSGRIINAKKFVKECYLEFLRREADIEGFNHYVELLENRKIDEVKLVEIFKNSDEFRRINT